MKGSKGNFTKYKDTLVVVGTDKTYKGLWEPEWRDKLVGSGGLLRNVRFTKSDNIVKLRTVKLHQLYRGTYYFVL